MGMPKVSVILTSYNKAQFVGRAIESVLRQTLGDLELFIMDDNSNEETQQVIHPYLHDSRVQYYRSEVKNADRHKKTRYAVLINLALSWARGEYISYITDDNYFHAKRLEVMSRFLDQHPDVQTVYSAQQITELDKNCKPLNTYTRRTEGVLAKAAARVDHCSVMHRRKILDIIYEKYGNYWDEDPKYWGFADAVFWDRLNEYWPFYPIDEVLDYNLRTPFSYKTRHLGVPSFASGETFIPDGTLVKGTEKAIYYVDVQKRRPIRDMDTFDFLKFCYGDVLEIPDPILFKYPKGEVIDKQVFYHKVPNNILIKSFEQNRIYVIQDGRKRWIVDMETFLRFGYRMEEVIWLPQDVVDSIPNGANLSSRLGNGMMLPNRKLFKHNNRYYLSINNNLHPIESRYVIRKLQLPINQVIELPPFLFDQYVKGTAIVYYW